MSDSKVIQRRVRRMLADHFDDICPVRDEVIDPDLDDVSDVPTDDRHTWLSDERIRAAYARVKAS